MATPDPIKRLQKPKPKAPAPLSRPQDMWTPDWDRGDGILERANSRVGEQRVIERGNPGIVRRP